MKNKKEKDSQQEKKQYQKVGEDGKYTVYRLTIEEALQGGFCGLCKAYVGQNSEFRAYPLPGICSNCRKKVEIILNNYELIIVGIPSKGEM